MNQRQRDVIDYLREENCVLREQFGKRRLRSTDNQRRRLAVRGKKLSRKLSTNRKPGRPVKQNDLTALVIRMAQENRDRGYRRLQGTLVNLGHECARSTIAAMLRRHGIEPAPERNRKTTWKEFLKRHWDLIVAADFFTVEVWTRRGLTRFLVLLFIDLETRRVEIAGIASRERPVDEPSESPSNGCGGWNPER